MQGQENKNIFHVSFSISHLSLVVIKSAKAQSR